ncbi:MAG TPA: hypothetical protein VHY22_14300 [Chthoniobacteraceae bacterium]|jgi:hypothetical protein|nr:hypothetical protein [Chthoniobacteraceae bacterium]
MDATKWSATRAIPRDVIAPAQRLGSALNAIKPVYFSNSAQGIDTGPTAKETPGAFGSAIAHAAIQSIGVSTRKLYGPPASSPEYALAVSLIFTKATNQSIMLGTPPGHVLSTSILWASLVHDKRFEQVPMNEAAPGDIVIGSGWQQGADGYAGIAVAHRRIVSNSSRGVQDNSSVLETQRSHPGMIAFRYVGFWNYYRSKTLANAGFNPAETRLPAGQPGGGQWTTGGAQLSGVGRRTAGLRAVHDARQKSSNCETLSNGTVVHREGHHVSPVQTWKDNTGKTIFSKDVTDRLDEVRIRNDDIDHTNSLAHREYNARAQAIVDQFVQDAKKAGIDPASLTGEDAREFANKLISELESDGYLSKFNELVKEGNGTATALNAMRKTTSAEGILKESDATGAVEKAARWLAEKGGIAAEHLPGVLKALGLAAAIAEFKSDAKAKGVKEAARTQYYRFGDALGQTPEEDQAMRQKASHWFYKLIGADQN